MKNILIGIKIDSKLRFGGNGLDKTAIQSTKRAVGLAGKKRERQTLGGFNGVVGVPRKGWQDGFQDLDKKTVYFLMIEKEA